MWPALLDNSLHSPIDSLLHAPPTMTDELSFTARYARRLTRETIIHELCAFYESSGTKPSVLHNESDTDHPRALDQTVPLGLKFCIIGAGMAGLYTAMILKELGIQFDLLEASDRIGGRVYTHRFSEKHDDYYDAGAMRWPNIPVMKKVFSLFEELHIPLMPNYTTGKNTPMMFNNILGPPLDPSEYDPFKFGIKNGGMVPDEYLAMGAQKILQEACEPYLKLLREDFEHGFKKLMEVDDCSIREYLRTYMHLDYYTIQWLETNMAPSDFFDQSFSEYVILGSDFMDAQGFEWKCVDGGSAAIISAMLDRITPCKPECRTTVTGIALNRTKSKVEVKLVDPTGQSSIRQYDTVFNTTSLACSRNMDLVNAELHPVQRDALRCLRYDTTCKIGMKFKTSWWVTQCGITKGGMALSDLPIRTCSYPSTIHNDPNTPAVLLASDTIGQDAQRITSLVNRDSPAGESRLKELILRDLARLHARSGITYDFLASQYITHYAFDWGRHPFTGGAFAIFGPGQFSHLYPYLTRPAADGRLHFAGEASSAHHAWIVGALESAQRAVVLSLLRFGRRDLAKKVEERWGPVPELDWEGQDAAHVQAMLGLLWGSTLNTTESLDDPSEHFQFDTKCEKSNLSVDVQPEVLSTRSGCCIA